MDPNVCLEDLLESIEAMKECQTDDTDSPQFCVVPNYVVTSMIDRFEALDEWMSKGGFPPKAWKR